MSAETLRRAATLMRERAEAALGPDYEWKVDVGADERSTWWAFTDEDHLCANGILTLDSLPQWTDRLNLWEHITGWSPAVALAVADWLDHAAQHAETRIADGWALNDSPCDPRALNVARAYLGEAS